MNGDGKSESLENPRDANARAGIGWLLMDMALVSGGMTALVKAQGVTYPAFQLVFIRAMIGLLFILPLIWRHRMEMVRVQYPWRNIFRICCNAIALTSNFIAITLLPLATVNAVGFSRPLVTMAMAVAILGERVSRYRWAGACLAFVGVLIVIGPGGAAFNAGVLVVLVSVVFGALAVIQTRALRQENTTVMMVFYTVGLAVITAVPAIWTWKPVAPLDWGPLLAIGLLAQLGQYCFLRAYRIADASVLAPVGYLSILFVTAVGYFLFDEVPEARVVFGIVIILVSLQSTALAEYLLKRLRRRR
ncbi:MULTISPECIES: DMT family transporter [Rhizobium/Agrobacterium group]|uniref:DMT family transporter n=1 Tax=Rhizobium/Agrobacterium group TaxID=227290 RepID=UPI00107F7B6E|nr:MULTISPECIES: DMT family transporter [Rhizobium/Agrobacterium group]NTB99668.1 DMT family transporter [Agrobacterium tumefaciens]MBB4401207.1 S-adenosylmethionine uptake transporter [Agrobacterium radiobacter]MBB5588186.1 S-adenosylmethionine uptake transporter [Agrobacterium radiobacter]NTC44527.1 DMT family transporter [Agrobacterium tumefaciens]TGE90799.1 EamA/RhaT family transporter [Rhizobium sp. SEMIA 4032]